MAERKIQTIERFIHYYDLQATFREDFRRNSRVYDTNFQALLSKITRLVKDRSEDRYQRLGDKFLFINEIGFTTKANKKTIKGKLLSVRKDVFPELLNTNTDSTRDIEAAEEEGIVETTHFIIKEETPNTDDVAQLAIEFNQYGARVADLKYYLEAIGIKYGMVSRLEFQPIIIDSLDSLRSRIGQVSKIKIRIKHDNISVLRNMIPGAYSGIELASEEFAEDVMTIELKYDIRQARENPNLTRATRAREIVSGLIRHLVRRKSDVERFEALEVVAEDSEKHNKLNAFDLLIDKAKDKFRVEKKERSRVLISADMFEKMLESWNRVRI